MISSRWSRRLEVRSFDSEFDDSDTRRVEVTFVEKPLLEVVRTGDRAREVSLEDE